jgi:hypothetical protein
VPSWGEWNADIERIEISGPGDVLIRTLHRIDPLDDGRCRVTYRMEITGPAADSVGPELGPEISGDFPETLAALVEMAVALDLHDS